MKPSGVRDLVLYGIAIIIAGITVGFHAVPPKIPVLLQQWNKVPMIVVCDTAPSWAWDSTLKATTALRKEGFKLGSVIRGPCNEKCHLYECVKGAVVIDTATVSTHRNFEDALGVCHLPDGVPVATWAVIEVMPDPPDAEILIAHELGHCALGYGHVQSRTPYLSPPKGHIMHPKLDEAGWSVSGMKRD